MKDVFGNELMIGDEVAVINGEYKGLVLGMIEKITPKRIIVSSDTFYQTKICSSEQVIKRMPIYSNSSILPLDK